MTGAGEEPGATPNREVPSAPGRDVLACMVVLGYIPPGSPITRPFWQEHGLAVLAAFVAVALGSIAYVRRRRRREQGSRPNETR